MIKAPFKYALVKHVIMKLSPWAFTDELNTDPEMKCFLNAVCVNNSFWPDVNINALHLHRCVNRDYYSKTSTLGLFVNL